MLFQKPGRGSRNRTHTKGFGDLYSTVELCPYKDGGGGRIRTAEPEGADLQSAAFSHFATPPRGDAGDRSRTHDLLITSQLLYQLSYTGIYMVEDDGLEPPTPCL